MVHSNPVELSTRPTDHVSPDGEVSATPLTQTETAELVEILVSNFGLSREQAQKMLSNITPQQARTLMGLMNGSDSITRDEAIAMWGLSAEEANILFPEGKPLSTFTNPFGKAFIDFLMLTYALELDLKQILSEVLDVQKNESIAKAEEFFKGAITQFAAAMTAAVLTGVLAGAGALKAYKAKKSNKNPADGPKNNLTNQDRTNAAADNMWFSPIGISLITQPVNAGGELGNSWYQREGAYHEAEAEEARGIYQQLMSMYDSTGQLSRGVAQNL